MMNVTRQLAIACLGLFVLLAVQGCGDSASEAAGTWELDTESIKTAMQAQIDAEGEEPDPMAVAMMQGMIDAMQMTLVLNADGTASSDLSMMGQNEKTTGTWSISGETITLNLADEGVEPEPVTGTLRGDRLEIHAQDDEMPVNMIFKRK